MPQSTSASPLPLATKLFYGVGQMVWGAKDLLFHILLLFHYQQNLGLSGTLLGVGAVVVLILDAVTDPLVGHLSDRTQTRFGRRHPYMAVSVIPIALCFYAVLNPPSGLGTVGLFAWYVAFSALSRVMVTLFTVPHTSLAAELTEDYDERTNLFGFRIGFGYLSALVLQIIVLGFVLSDDSGGLGNQSAYGLVGAIIAGVALVGGVISIVGTANRIGDLHARQRKASDAPWWHALHEFVRALSLKNFRLFMVSSMMYGLLLGVAQSLILHMLDFYYQFSDLQKAGLMAVILLSLVPAHYLAGWSTARMGKARAAALTLLIGGAFGSGHVTLKLMGVLPEAGTSNLFYWIAGLVWINQSFLIAYLIVQGSMIGDIVDEYAAKTGKHQAGVFAAAQVFISKIPFGIGVLCAGLILDISGFAPGMPPGAVEADILIRFGWFVGPGLFLVTLGAIFPLVFYDLTKERLEQLRSSLQDTGKGRPNAGTHQGTEYYR